jgi:hypothetical protein
VISIALGIPNTPWVEERAKSMQRVRESLGLLPIRRVKTDIPPAPPISSDSVIQHAGEMHLELVMDPPGPQFYREFTEKESNKIWPRKMWNWMISTGADWCLSVQDDTLHAPYFWKALRAMLTYVPENQVLGLSSVHPMAGEMARQGRRWYRTRSWLIGWAYAMRRGDLQEFVAWSDARPKLVAERNEDDLINMWVHDSGRSTYHPVPTIVDHDTSIESQYKNDEHSHRRSTSTWRDFEEGSLCSEDFWLPSGIPQLLPVPHPRGCWYCVECRPAVIASGETGAAMCAVCLTNSVASVLKVNLQRPPT